VTELDKQYTENHSYVQIFLLQRADAAWPRGEHYIERVEFRDFGLLKKKTAEAESSRDAKFKSLAHPEKRSFSFLNL
jgi:hypothetical protein